MKDTQKALMRENDIKTRANKVLGMTIGAIHGAQGADAQLLKLKESAAQNPMFEGVDPKFGLQVAGAWTAAIQQHQERFGSLPSPELLANAHKSLENLMTECAVPSGQRKEGVGKAMFESAAADMSTSAGVMKQALFAAMILPASLGAATSDACTFVPCTRDESDIYELSNVAASTFGSYQKGDELNMQSTGAFSQMRRTFVFPDANQPDGTEKTFTFTLKDLLGQAAPILAGRTKIMVNRRLSKKDDGDGNIYFNDSDFSGNSFSVNGKIDYSTGIVALTFTEAPADGTELAVQLELNVENQPSLIPVINQTMRKYEVSPSQYVLASEHSVQSASDLQREFGLNLQSQQFSAMTQWLSHEQDMARLRTLVFHTPAAYSRDYDVALPDGQTYESWIGIMRHAVNALSTDMVNRTLTSGIRGGFAGGEAANYLRSLPANVFQQDPGYVQSPYVQYIGTLFGNYKIFEVPTPACDSLVADGYDFQPNHIYFYGRGDSIGKAGLVAGDAVPAIPFVHPTNPSLVNRTTVWGSALNEVHPRRGEDYFARLVLTNSKVGAFNMLTGEVIEASTDDSSASTSTDSAAASTDSTASTASTTGSTTKTTSTTGSTTTGS